MKISIEWTPRVYYLKGVFFALLSLTSALLLTASHDWTMRGAIFVFAIFAFACLEFFWGFQLKQRAKRR